MLKSPSTDTDKVIELPSLRENHRSFLERLPELGLPPFLLRAVDRVYEFSKNAHDGQIRDGEKDLDGRPLRYFEHPRAVALIICDELADELKLLHPNTVATLVMSGLLHDVPEDTPALGSRRTKIPGDSNTWRETLREALSQIDVWQRYPDPSATDKLTLHHEALSTIVLGVTKLDKEELRALGILETDPNYHLLKVRLSAVMVEVAGPAAVLVKIADRLANFRTMDDLDPKRVVKKIRETQDHFVPIFQKFAADRGCSFAPMISKLLRKLENQMQTLQQRRDVALYDAALSED